MPRETTRSYAGRQVDLELLKHVDTMLQKQPVEPDIEVVPRITAGIEKAVQRYARIFLTAVGTVRLAPEEGNDLTRSIAMGRVQNRATLDHLYSIANARTLASLRESDARGDVYGQIADDERIVSTQLRNLEMVYDALNGGRVKVHVAITTASGDTFSFIIPVDAGVS